MMKILQLLILLMSANVYAQKVVQIDLDSSIVKMYDYKGTEELIERFVKQKNKLLDHEYNELEKIRADYAKDKDKKILEKFNKQEKEYQNKIVIYQEQINNYAVNQKAPLYRKLIRFAQEYSKNNKIDLLLDTSKSILYENNKVIDLSDEILRAYNSNKNK